MIELPRAALTADEIAEVGGVLLLRHQRPDPDDVGLLPRRRGGGVLLALPRAGHLPGVARSSPSTPTGVGALVSEAVEPRPGHATRPAPRGLRRARRRPALDPLLRGRRARLRLLLAVPGAGGAAGGRPLGPRRAPRPVRARRTVRVRTARRPASAGPSARAGRRCRPRANRPSRCSRARSRSSPAVRRTSSTSRSNASSTWPPSRSRSATRVWASTSSGLGGRGLAGRLQVDALGALEHLRHRQPGGGLGVGGVGVDQLLVLRDGAVDVPGSPSASWAAA